MNKKTTILALMTFLFLTLSSFASANTLMYSTFDDTIESSLGINDGASAGFSIYAYSVLEPSMSITVELIRPSGSTTSLRTYSNLAQQNYIDHFTVTKAIYNTTGTYTIRATARGATGSVSTADLTLNVLPVITTNNPPAFTSTPITSVDEGAYYSYQATAIDPEGSAVTYRLQQAPNWTSINPGTGLVYGTAPAIAADYNYGITIVATDGTYNVTQTYALTENNIAVPTPAVNAVLSYDNTSLRNMTILNGTSFSFSAYASSTAESSMRIRVNMLDSNGNNAVNVMNVLTTNTSYGRQFIITNLTYLNAGNYTLIENVTGASGTNSISTLSLEIFAPNNAPTITSTPVTSVNGNSTYNYQMSAIDPEGDLLTFFIESNPGWLSIDPITGLINGTSPEVLADGNYSVVVGVTDGINNATQPYTITVVYVAPVPAGIVLSSLSYNNSAATSMTIFDGDTIAVQADATSLFEPNMTIVVDLFDINGTFMGNILSDFTSLNFYNNVSTITNLTYLGVGNYSIVESVFGGRGSNDSMALSLEVISNISIPINGTNTTNTTNTTNATNTVPVLQYIGPFSIFQNQSIGFVMNASDADGDTLAYSAAGFPSGATFDNTTATFNWTPSFTQAGMFTFVVAVSDGSVTIGQAVDINVLPVFINTTNTTNTTNATNTAPVLFQIGNHVMNPDETLVLNLSAFDADLQNLTFSYDILPSNAAFIDNSDGTATFTFSPNLAQNGSYPIMFSVNDGFNTTSESIVITVNFVNTTLPNVPPIFSSLASQSVDEGSSLTFNVDATDMNGDALTITAFNLPANSNFTDLGNNTGVFVFGPDYNQAGLYNVDFNVTDGIDTSSIAAAILVNNTNRAPVLAFIPNVIANELDTIQITPFAVDPDGDIVTYLFAGTAPLNSTGGWTTTYNDAGSYSTTIIANDGIGGIASQEANITILNINRAPIMAAVGSHSMTENETLVLNLTATDADGDALAYSVNGNPANSNLIDLGNGDATFTFTPDFTQNGTYTITFNVNDTFGAVATETITIDVSDLNQAPVLAPIGNFILDENNSVDINFTATDDDGDALFFSSTMTPAISPSMVIASWTIGNTTFGTTSFTPNFTQAGIYTLEINVSDSYGAQDSKISIITVNNLNQAPVLSPISNQTIIVNQTLQINLSATDADLDAIAFNYSTDILSLTTLTDSGSGSASFTWTPDFTEEGNYTITFDVTDGTAIANQTISITVLASPQAPINNPPAFIIAPTSPITGYVNQTLIMNLTAIDLDNNTLTYSAYDLPLGATFDASTQIFNWTPTTGQDGTYNMTFNATDSIDTTSMPVSIIVLSVPANISPSSVNLGSAGNFAILAKSGISTTGTTSITGDIGVSPIAATAITGFGLIMDASNQFSTSSLVNGSVYASDYADPTPAMMTAAVSDMETAYTDAAGRTADVTELGAGNIGAMTLTPGVYKWSTGLTIPADLTLDCQGNTNDTFIFQIAQTLDISSGRQVILSGGCQAQNIFWAVAGQTTLGTTSAFSGTILDQTAIVLQTGASLNGRALAQTAVTLDSNIIASPNSSSPVVPVIPAGLNVIDSWIYGINFIANNSGDVFDNLGIIVSNDTIINNTNITNTIVPQVGLIDKSYLQYSLFTDVDQIINCTSIGASSAYNIIAGTSCVNQFIDPSTIMWSNITGTTPIINSTILYSNVTYSSPVENSFVNASDLNNTALLNAYLQGSIADDSDISNSNVTGSQVNNSTLLDSNVSGSQIDGSTLNSTQSQNSTIDDTTASNSTIINSNVTDSTIDNSQANTSTISASNITGSDITGSNISGCAIDNSTFGNATACSGSQVSDSNLTGSQVTNSTITNSTITDTTIVNGNVTNNEIQNGTTIIIGNVTIVINETANVTSYTNHAPIAGFSMPASALLGTSVAMTDASSDIDVGGLLNDSLTYTWVYSDGPIVASLTPGMTRIFNTAGTYTVTLVVTDKFGISSSAAHGITITSPATTTTFTGGSGGSGGGYTTSSNQDTTDTVSLLSQDSGLIMSYVADACLARGEKLAFSVNDKSFAIELTALVGNTARLRMGFFNYYDLVMNEPININPGISGVEGLKLNLTRIDTTEACIAIYKLAKPVVQVPAVKKAVQPAKPAPAQAQQQPAAAPAQTQMQEETILTENTQENAQSEESAPNALLMTGYAVLNQVNKLKAQLTWQGLLVMLITATLVVMSYNYLFERKRMPKYEF